MSASEYLENAIKLLKEEKEHDAIVLLNKALDLEPECGRLYFCRGEAFRALNRFNTALKDFEKAAELGIVSFDFWLAMGICQLKTGSFAEAEASLNHALESDAENADAYYWRGRSYFELKNYDSAIADLSRAVQLDDDNQGAKAFLSLSRSASIPIAPPPPIDWNNMPKSSYYKKAHRDAKALLKESFFWSIDEYGPIGGDLGMDCMEMLWKWRKKNPAESMRKFLDALLYDWGYDFVVIAQIANGDPSHCVGELHSVANIYDDTLIAISFGQFMVDGFLDDELRLLVLPAIERQSQQVVLDFRAGDTVYATSRQKIKEALLQMPDPPWKR
jgi:tetratricopeptide (TPR) repeat protein